MDLEQASREELLAIIGAQREQIATLEQQVGQLTEQVAKRTARLNGAAGRAFRVASRGSSIGGAASADEAVMGLWAAPDGADGAAGT